MKSLVFSALVAILSLNVSADCINAYEIKAAKRAHSNMVIKNTAAWSALVGGAAAGGALLGPGYFALTGAGGALIGTFATADSPNGPMKFFGESEDTTFHKVLDAINAANQDKLSKALRKKLDKKLNLSSFSDAEQERMEKEIVAYIKEENESERLCVEDNKIRTLTFNKLVQKIVEEVQL